MGKRSQSTGRWSKRHDAPVSRNVRVWVCRDCRKQGTQLVTGPDGAMCCRPCSKKALPSLETVLQEAG